MHNGKGEAVEKNIHVQSKIGSLGRNMYVVCVVGRAGSLGRIQRTHGVSCLCPSLCVSI